MKRVTSIGGIFFKCQEPDKIKEWYKQHLGFNTDQWGTVFEWRHRNDANKIGHSQWSPFAADTKYFEPSKKEFMVNYRVENLDWLVDELKKEGVTVIDEIAVYEYGKFVHILDPEGNAIELWEPIDEEFRKIASAVTK